MALHGILRRHLRLLCEGGLASDLLVAVRSQWVRALFRLGPTRLRAVHMCVPGEARSRPRLQSRLPSHCCGALGLRVLCGCSPRSRCPLPRLPCSQLLLSCFALPLRQSASLTACGGEYVNGQRPITANGDYRLQYSCWTLTHQPFSDLDCRRLQVGHLHLVLDTCALHVRPPQQVGVRSQGSIGRAPLYPVGVRGARYHGQGSWAGECGSPGSLGKGELGSWSERAHNPIAQETAISIQCRAATQ